MTKILRTQVLRLLAATFFATAATYGSPSASAQGPRVIAPANPTAARWLDQWLGMETGGGFVLAATTAAVRVARLNQPRRFRVCVTGATPAGHNLGAMVITETAELAVPVGYCGELDARQVTVVPATALGRTQQIHGYHEIIG